MTSSCLEWPWSLHWGPRRGPLGQQTLILQLVLHWGPEGASWASRHSFLHYFYFYFYFLFLFSFIFIFIFIFSIFCIFIFYFLIFIFYFLFLFLFFILTLNLLFLIFLVAGQSATNLLAVPPGRFAPGGDGSQCKNDVLIVDCMY